ncbi:MAG: TolC family protein, partial [Verrucomicrobiales bacterium]|nr:TolC family protein [Verrucomicrobiales bacterium]
MSINTHPKALWPLLFIPLSGCLTPHDPPPLVPVENYTFASTNKASHTPWWQPFKNRDLDKLVDSALDRNLDLAALSSRILEADAELRAAQGQLFPTLDADSSFRSRWTDSDSTPSNSSQTPSLGALLNYEADIWGRLRSQRNAARAGQRATVADWHATRLILSAAVAETYFGILEQQHQLALAAEQIGTGQTLLDLTELRFGQAQSSIVDVLQQREQLAGTSARV